MCNMCNMCNMFHWFQTSLQPVNTENISIGIMDISNVEQKNASGRLDMVINIEYVIVVE